MNSLVVWGHSYCRSTLAFYRGLASAFGVPLKVFLWKPFEELRKKTGFSDNEFGDIDITFVGDDLSSAMQLLQENKESHHLFCAYQSALIHRLLMKSAAELGCHFAIGSEAPCNMDAGFKRLLKSLYMRWSLPLKLKESIQGADFLINYSGDDTQTLMTIGWPTDKIIACGYYSPRIPKSRLIHRSADHWQSFTILLSGIHQWHRSPLLLIKALGLLKKRGLEPVCNITQNGPLLEKMKSLSLEYGLKNVNFLGFVSLDKLCELYETCSVYVGAGNDEPWGIRLNDALMCGVPLVVNEGMGGVKMVKDYGCGLSFGRDDASGLADCIELLMRDQQKYLEVSDKAYAAASMIAPDNKAKEIAISIRDRFPDWR